MFRERVELADGFFLEVFFHSPSDYRLTFGKRKRVLVEYSDKDRGEFKSVEQLRYDFERDVENAQRQGR